MTAKAVRTELPVIDVAGSHLEIGRGIGESLRDGLQRVADGHREGLERSIGWNRALAIARTLIPFADASLPDVMAELRGMSEGSGVDFETLFSMNALQETRFMAGTGGFAVCDEGCTSLAVTGSATANGHVMLAHNEDAGTIRSALPYVVRARPNDGPAFVGFAYSGLLLYQGMNEYGVGSVGNALYFGDIRQGFPKLLTYRDVLNATFLEDAIQRTHQPGRANGNNHLLANDSGELYDVEVSGGDWALLPATGEAFVHANHALDSRMQGLELNSRPVNSIIRQHRVERLLARSVGELTVDTLFEILSDHSNFPKSVCKHADRDHNPDTQTVASVVVDLTAREIHVRPGHPCSMSTTSISLDA
jgi:isopenicillin-N N-acyltransferase like protein